MVLVATIRAHVAHQWGNIQKLFRRLFGFRIRWIARFVLGYRKPSYFGLEGLDQKVLEAIDTSPSYYIEIGANDGVSQSNTLALELFYGWKGLLIEPANSTFEKLKRNRTKRRNYLLRSACVSRSFPQATVDLIYANLMSIAVGLDSDVPDPGAHAASGEKFLSQEDSVSIESVPAITMTRALEIAGAPGRIGLLSLDVEGAELEVLRGIDFQKYHFGWILVESRSVQRITSFLEKNGYAMQSKLSAHDYLFAQQQR